MICSLSFKRLSLSSHSLATIQLNKILNSLYRKKNIPLTTSSTRISNFSFIYISIYIFFIHIHEFTFLHTIADQKYYYNQKIAKKNVNQQEIINLNLSGLFLSRYCFLLEVSSFQHNHRKAYDKSSLIGMPRWRCSKCQSQLNM